MPKGYYGCSVTTCKNKSIQCKKDGKDTVKFFGFPKDPELSNKWKEQCRRKTGVGKWKPKHKRICSVHFKAEDFEDHLKARLLNIPPKKLKKDAIPTLFMPRGDYIIEESKQTKLQKRKLLIDAIIAEAITDAVDDGEKTNVNDTVISQKSLNTENEKLKHKVASLENTVSVMRQRIIDLELNYEALFEGKVKQSLKHVFTANQVEILLKKKTVAHWSKEELAKAYGLRYFSKRCYKYLRYQLHYPLPGVQVLDRWATNIRTRKASVNDHTYGSKKNVINALTLGKLSDDEDLEMMMNTLE